MEVDFITLKRENAPVLTFGEVSNSSHFKGDCHDVSKMLLEILHEFNNVAFCYKICF